MQINFSVIAYMSNYLFFFFEFVILAHTVKKNLTNENIWDRHNNMEIKDNQLIIKILLHKQS